MSTFFYTDAGGQRQGPMNIQQLNELTASGIITPNTTLEAEGGHKGIAGQVPELNFNNTPSHFAQSVQTVPVPLTAQQLFCTNCGNSISEHTVACMSCGAKPVGHRKFCHKCGTTLNSEQVICIECGTGIGQSGVINSLWKFFTSK
ncbi:MAG: GYF domain-containing protein [Planctomycetaceae bacterium]|nr:GYF domain-containing protein [Planctomycetaceae bacterium]